MPVSDPRFDIDSPGFHEVHDRFIIVRIPVNAIYHRFFLEDIRVRKLHRILSHADQRYSSAFPHAFESSYAPFVRTGSLYHAIAEPPLGYLFDTFDQVLLKKEGITCLILDIFHWTRLSIAISLIRELDVPSALYANTSDGWNGIPAVTAISGSMREISGSRNLMLLERFIDTDQREVISWLKGIAALNIMRKSSVMCFGGTYGADMPYTRSDLSFLETRLIREILMEQDLGIVQRTETLVKTASERIDSFMKWLTDNKVYIEYDNDMLSANTLRYQIAQYLAVKDRLGELREENIAGISVKCHYEISTEIVGCTQCLIPAFLPLPEDAEGRKPILPVSCEGDINGLLSLVLLHAVNPDVPPLFGDLAQYREDFVLLRNCGSSSMYWAARSPHIRETLAKTRLLPNIHGRSGCAVGYETPKGGDVTFARLFRAKEEFFVFLGKASVMQENADSRYPDPWPHTRLHFGSNFRLLFKAAPCNHGSITEGNWVQEIETLCRYCGIKIVHCDKNASLEAFLADLAS